MQLRKSGSDTDSALENETGIGNVGIKIDTEGYELEIVKGAKTLQKQNF